MKEYLRLIWKQENKAAAAEIMDDWIARASSSGVRMLVGFARTLQIHRRGILAYYDFPISTGPLGGTNNKIKTLQKQAYGFREREFFKLKIYALHEARYALVDEPDFLFNEKCCKDNSEGSSINILRWACM